MEDDEFQISCLPLATPIASSIHSKRKYKSSQWQTSSSSNCKMTKWCNVLREEPENILPRSLRWEPSYSFPPGILGSQFDSADMFPSRTDSGNSYMPLRGETHRHFIEGDYSSNSNEQSQVVRTLAQTWSSPNSLESRLLSSSNKKQGGSANGSLDSDGRIVDSKFEPDKELDVPIRQSGEYANLGSGGMVECPLCSLDISDYDAESRQLHTNSCIDKCDTNNELTDDGRQLSPREVTGKSSAYSPQETVGVASVIEWLCSLGLANYKSVFMQEEIDWDTLQWLTEEDLINIGVTALGPRKKIVNSLDKIRGVSHHQIEMERGHCKRVRPKQLDANRLITDYFHGPVCIDKRACGSAMRQDVIKRDRRNTGGKIAVVKRHSTKGNFREIPLWCCVPGTPFRVDGFQYLSRDCSHWFLTHFHIDHYQGLTRSFAHGKIYCSMVTAKLVNMKIGIPWDILQVLPLNQTISIAGVQITCFDANHYPGSMLILFEPPNGKAILHTGDFRFCKEMKDIHALQTRSIHTLILDTTYCDPQYDFPKQDAVVQFVIEAIQAESFNSRTLFLIGSYTVGKERLFVEVARALQKKVFVASAKLRLLECMELPEQDMQRFTENEQETNVHVVPMWTVASFKRLKQLSSRYADRFSLVVAFSPTGWTFGKGKKKSAGRRWQQGTIIRYEVPYSEHCNITELREFVKLLSPLEIIPSVNNEGEESANAMVSLLTT